jgi:N-acetylglucosamine-6-phosphate deacetylase
MRSNGLFDIHINGYAGVDFNSSALTADALDHALEAMLLSGVTACLPTLITAPEDVLAARFAALDEAVARSRLGPAMVPGYHLEGPFLNPAPGYAGCHPAAAMVLPDSALVERIARDLRCPIRLLTLAPERNGALPLIAWARSHRIVVAMGHTAANAACVGRAADAGLALSTHLGNALPQPQPKFLNPMMAQLAEDRLHASFIADGIHIPKDALKVLLRAKGLARSILVTDATAAAGAPPGARQCGARGVRVVPGSGGTQRRGLGVGLAGRSHRDGEFNPSRAVGRHTAGVGGRMGLRPPSRDQRRRSAVATCATSSSVSSGYSGRLSTSDAAASVARHPAAPRATRFL